MHDYVNSVEGICKIELKVKIHLFKLGQHLPTESAK